MREKIVLPPLDEIEIFKRQKPKPDEKTFFGLSDVPPMPSFGDCFNVTVTGSTHDEYGIRSTADPIIHRRLVERLVGKIFGNADKIIDYEAYNVDKCKVGIVSFGCTSRTVYETVELAEKQEINVGFVRLKTLWPFPEQIIRKMTTKAETVFVPEMNLRQVFYEVQRVVRDKVEVVPLNKIGAGEMITPEELLAEIQKELR
jgi:2-oxoglutarate ferredoxin oxidoreductase subunit alpha